MRSDIALGQRAEDRVAQRVKTDIAIRIGGKSAVMRNRDAGKHHRPGPVTEFMNIEPGAGADVGGRVMACHEHLSVAGKGRQNVKVTRCRQLPKPFVAGNGGNLAARCLDKLDIVGDLGCRVMSVIKGQQMVAPEDLRRLGAAQIGPRCSAVDAAAGKCLQRIDDRQDGKRRLHICLHGLRQSADHLLREKRARRIMDGDKPGVAVGGCQPGAHRILPPGAAGGDCHPVFIC